jgi:hypothetical protein
MASITRLSTTRFFASRISAGAGQRIRVSQPLLPVGAWAAVVAAGCLVLWNYAGTPGPSVNPPLVWPEDSALVRSGTKCTLAMFAHPHCPCTRASIRQLERLLACCGESLDTLVVFVEPPGLAHSATQSDLWRSAAAIPGVRVVEDRDGIETHRFGAATSGECRLYDSTRKLLFHGGITPARGHEGDNLGRSAIQAIADGRPAEPCAPTFGCPLSNSANP